MPTGNRKIWKQILLIFLAVVIGVFGFLTWVIFSPNVVNVEKNTYLYVPTGGVYKNVLDSLKKRQLLKYPKNFNEVARLVGYPEHVIAGKYELKPGMSAFKLAKLLYSGAQTPVRLVINKERTKENIAQLFAANLEPDSAAFMDILEDSAFLSQFSLDTNTAVCAIIPNTYQFFWNTDAKATFRRMVKEHDKFWTAQRKSEADSLGLSTNEVYILASIVEEESNQLKEKPLIASVYLNRLRKGINLYADPTLKFALKDFALKRISGDALKVNSPYNTYLNPGLPPGPICTPSIKTIDAVLHASNTNYLYFAAKPDFSGLHNFAETYAEHLKNAKAYHEALNKRGIK